MLLKFRLCEITESLHRANHAARSDSPGGEESKRDARPDLTQGGLSGPNGSHGGFPEMATSNNEPWLIHLFRNPASQQDPS